MRNSNLSGISKISTTKMIEQYCSQHEGQLYTNFCSSVTCIKPLCPECIENHYNHHKNLRIQPQIDSFKSLKYKCMNKIRQILSKIDGDQNGLMKQQLSQMFDQSLMKIKEAKDHCKKIVESYFLNLEDHLRKKRQNILTQDSDYLRDLQRSQDLINQLKDLNVSLENSKSFIESAKTTLRLDAQKIQNKIKQGYQTLNEFKKNHQESLYIEKNYQHKITSFLSKTFFYGNFDNLETTPKLADQLISQSRKNYRKNSTSQQRPRSQNKMHKDIEYQNMHTSGNFEQLDCKLDRRRNSFREQEDRRQTMSRKSSSKSVRSANRRTIMGMSTFKQSAYKKYLHFFQNEQNILHILDLQQDSVFQSIQLKINFSIPKFHKSISTPNGDLYLIGGSIGGIKSKKIYKYDFNNNTLLLCNNLKYGRSSHSVCFNSNYIYILGGFIQGQTISSSCEKYDVKNNIVQNIHSMNYPTCSFACASFNGRFIYKFGGIGQDKTVMHYIELYDQKQAKWTLINPIVEIQKGLVLKQLTNSAAVQITQNQIMVMGGYDNQSVSHNQTYILKVQNDQTIIKDVNTFPLPQAEGFWNNTPIVYKKTVFCLQNIGFGDEECSENQRRILMFDGLGWKSL